jgi:prevent-host-death family protein
MITVNISNARTQLSKLVGQAAAGEDVIIAKSGNPVARLTQLDTTQRKIRFGVLKGKVSMANDFDAPLSLGILAEHLND